MRFTFDRFELDLERRVLLENDVPQHVSPKALVLLEKLLQNTPRALSKKELTDAVWPATFVEESNLANLVAELRSLFSDRRKEPRFIRTVHGYGYAFCGDVQRHGDRARAGVALFAGSEHPLYEGVNILGRDPSAQIMIDDATVSRRHASITIQNGAVTVEDLGSKNGTFLHGDRLSERAEVHDGDTIVLGDARVVYRARTGPSTTLTVGVRK
jgi:DNA-binding winged helix-turn-helix (wHTH) protein